MRKANTRILNITARRLGGVGRSARIESLHFCMGAQTVDACMFCTAQMSFDCCLRAEGCLRLYRELVEYYEARGPQTEDGSIEMPLETIGSRPAGEPLPSVRRRTAWFRTGYADPSQEANVENITSPFVAVAAEIEQLLIYQDIAYRFRNTYTRTDVASQELETVSWCPECNGYRQDNLAKRTPP